jgi:hypothetical protein
MNKAREKAMWEDRIKRLALQVKNESGCGAVMIALFETPWPRTAEEACAEFGFAGSPSSDLKGIAGDLRTAADAVESSEMTTSVRAQMD